MNTVTIFGKQFHNATDALISVLEDLEHTPGEIEHLDFVTFPGLATAFKYYAKRGLTDDVIRFFAQIVLPEEIDELTDDLIARTAWELADHSETFEVNNHALEIRA